jgi:D-Tyr-tRNAtyr deacylase
MRKIKLDRYVVKFKKMEGNNSNYNISVRVFEDKELIMGWHVKENYKEVDVISQFLLGVEVNTIKST